VIQNLVRVHANILSCGTTGPRFCNTHDLEYVPQRVVSLQPSATVILRDLGRHPDPAGPRIRPQRMRLILVRFLVSIAVALLVLAAKLTPEARVHEHKTPRR